MARLRTDCQLDETGFMTTVELQAVIFDLDDTLIDWSRFSADWLAIEARHIAGFCEFVRANGFDDFVDAEAFGKEFRSRSSEKWMSARDTLIAPNLGSTLIETAEYFGVPRGALDPRRSLEAYQWGAVPGTYVFPEVPDVLQQLHDAGLKIGLVTNAYQPMWLRDIEMENHGLLRWFPDCRISAADFGYLKPHPTIFEASLQCLGVSAEAAVFVGDDPNADIVGAKGVGMKAVLRSSRRFLSHHGVLPDGRIDSLYDLLPLLDAWFPTWRVLDEA
ncbi:HAD family hydrolase [Anaerolineae bacterium CFX9]|nr:HAD family hydrolase [Anaerolineae bacterium CFX9]